VTRLDFATVPHINPLAVEAPDLIDLFERKTPRAIDNWRELGAEEYARSFTAARTMGYDVVGDIYDAFVKTLQERDATGEDFADRLLPLLRVNLIYNTNLRMGQAVGYWDRIQKNKAALPYLLGVTAKDLRVRHPPKSPHSDHRAFEGILLPVDHSFWQSYFPPLGFLCRCSVVQRTRSQAARLGKTVTSEDELAARVARLGEPWGFSPGASALASIQKAAEAANADRLEGAPPIVPEAEMGRAADAWNAQLAQASAKTITALIQSFFGPA
jgi:hypothetical protein